MGKTQPKYFFPQGFSKKKNFEKLHTIKKAVAEA